MSASSLDPDVAAAFGGAPTQVSAPSTGAVDPDVIAAFNASSSAQYLLNPPKNIPTDPGLQGLDTPGAAMQGAQQILGMPGKALTGYAVRHGVENPYAAAAIGILPDLAEDYLPGGRKAIQGVRNILTKSSPITPQFEDPQAIADRSLAGQSQSAAASVPDVTQASSQLQRAIQEQARKSGGIVNPQVLQNHLEADRFGVQLTEGQASRDPSQFSMEQNSTDPDMVSRINKQNGQLVDALDNIRREVSPSNVSNSARENGQVVVDDLKNYDKPIVADIKSKYDAANAASTNGSLQMDGSSFVQRANAALKPQGKFRFLPPSVQGILTDVGESGGKMSLDDFQGYSTQLAAEVRKAQRAGDGNAVAAISKVRDELEATPPANAESAQGKALYDQARTAAKTRFDALRADPAYEAAVDEASGPGAITAGKPSPLADTFLDDYALGRGAPKSQLDLMTGKLSGEGKEALASHTLSAIRKGAVSANGNVLPNGYNTAIAKYSDKLPSLLDSKTVDDLTSLGNVITNAKVAPPGNFVNYSKSGVIMNAAQKIGEGALNAKTFGLGVPILKTVLKNNWARDSLAPGAGLGRLSDLVQPGPNP